MSYRGINYLTVVLNERGLGDIHRAADAASNPRHPDFGKHLSRDELRSLATPPDEALAAVKSAFEAGEMAVTVSDIPQVLYVEATDQQLSDAFGPEFLEWIHAPESSRSARSRWGIPATISSWVKGIHAHREDNVLTAGLLGKGIEGTGAAAPEGGEIAVYPHRPDSGAGRSPPSDLGGFSPECIRRVYDFPDQWTGKGEVIGLMNLGGTLDPKDLDRFWSCHALPSPEVHVVRIGPAAPPEDEGKSSFLSRLEVTMTTQWLGAMAPDATIVIYDINTHYIPDPWVAMLEVALHDAHGPSVLVSSWTLPERTYYSATSPEVVTDLLAQAAAVGVTMVVATGDWGVYDGRPRERWGGVPVVRAPWPHGTFPAVEDRVLSVGGTMITCRQPHTELAWSGPLPPNDALRQGVPLECLASSGGFSEFVPIPGYQAGLFERARMYSRGSNTPAVMPFGRGYPDVALAAQGRAVHRPDFPGLSSEGYQALVQGTWIDWGGGTSVAAPIWGAIVARMNEARRAAGKSRVGCVTPVLYELAARATDPETSPFRDIDTGHSDVILRVLNSDQRTMTWQLAGFVASHGWDPVTGLGVPRVDRLIDAAVAWDPPASGIS